MTLYKAIFTFGVSSEHIFTFGISTEFIFTYNREHCDKWEIDIGDCCIVFCYVEPGIKHFSDKCNKYKYD